MEGKENEIEERDSLGRYWQHGFWLPVISLYFFSCDYVVIIFNITIIIMPCAKTY
jgi:hypothetical protein